MLYPENDVEQIKIPIMRKVILISLLCLGYFAQGQTPQLTVKDADSLKVKMSQLLVNVKIVGNIAYTTTEMHFTNKTTRQMEAELLFPLPEGVSVSRYAIDINGKMRDAVPVNKNKGKQVFEAIEHRRVDPGLLEKVEGNNFKTRIYPIMPNGERIVLIGYEQELSSLDKNHLGYQMLSKYPYALDKFEVTITVLGATSRPTLIENDNELSMESANASAWQQSYQTAIKKVNFKPLEKWMVKIPIQQEIPSVVSNSANSQHYFYASTFIESAKIEKKKPTSIGLIWDVSLSCKTRDLNKELALLDAYFQNLKNTKVALYLLSYTFDKKQTFTITEGNWAELKAELQNTKYDGGTRFSEIKLPLHDEYLFFTDGLSSLSNNTLEKTTKPLYTISSSAASDYAFLNYNALKTGANFINLNQLNVAQALEKLRYQSLKFLGIKENYQVTEIYPSIGTPVSGSFSICGVSLKPKNELIMLFGYNENAIIEKKIVLDTQSHTTSEINIEKLWAQRKIADLELQYKKNEIEIEAIGKKYGIITPNTSLIVLESINDYIAYDITPPTELRAEFDRIVKEQRENRLAQQQNSWKNIESYYATLQSWWNKNTKYTTPKPLPKPKVRPNRRNISNTNSSAASRSVNGLVSGIIVEETGLPLPGVSVRVRGKNIGVSTDFDGKYSIAARQGEVLEMSYIGFESIAVTVGAPGSYNVVMNEDSSELQEVVVNTSYRSNVKRSVAYSVVTVTADSTVEEKEEANKSAKAIPNLQGQAVGLNVTNGTGQPGGAIDIIHRDGDKQDTIGFFATEGIKITTWNPDRIYLKVLEEAPADKKYIAYLELRESQINNPSFYFDVANYFYNLGDRSKALLVLSNIADLGLENHQLYKSLTYVFRQWESYEDALFTATQVAKWRIQEPQAHRDLALALEDNKQYQSAFDELIKALETNYFGEMSGQYAGVEDIILMDINRMVSEHSSIKTDKLDKKYLNKMPVSVRIILNWNQMDTDIDMHVVEPTGEECYYGHINTEAGARFSKDFTQGYGPEQYLLRNPVKGPFVIKTNFFGEQTLTENGPTTVMVEIYTYKNGKTERKLQTIQLGKVRENQSLAEVTIE